jgi:hypothetical protein
VEQTQFPRSTTTNRVVMGKISTEMINDVVGKKIHATDKLLENIDAKMDNFTIATQN